MPHLPGVEAMMAKDEASRGLGIELIDQGEGRAVTRMTVRDDMVNGHAIAHGRPDLSPSADNCFSLPWTGPWPAWRW